MYRETATILQRCLPFYFAAAVYTSAQAQSGTPAVDNAAKTTDAITVDTAMKKMPDPYFQKPHLAVGFSVGSNALLGVDVAYSITPKWGIKLGYNYLDLTYADLTPILKAANLPPELKGEVIISQSHLALTAEFTPTASKLFRVAVGGVYFMKNQLEGTIKYASGFQLNQMNFDASEMGYMKGTYTTSSSIAPYIGLGLGRTVPKKRIGLSVEVGGIYKGEPQIKIEATGLLKGNVENEAILNRNFKPLQWHPVANVRLAIKLN
jgi:hypothetical protein